MTPDLLCDVAVPIDELVVCSDGYFQVRCLLALSAFDLGGSRRIRAELIPEMTEFVEDGQWRRVRRLRVFDDPEGEGTVRGLRCWLLAELESILGKRDG